ncbi:MAG: hypothetical protein ACO20W_09925, partial [Anaerohalosphaeraceae bacterium]
MKISLNQKILSRNEQCARKNKAFFKKNDVVCLNVISSPGSGKTTTAAKLARWIKDRKGLFPLLVPADTSRPAAREQLLVLVALV